MGFVEILFLHRLQGAAFTVYVESSKEISLLFNSLLISAGANSAVISAYSFPAAGTSGPLLLYFD